MRALKNAGQTKFGRFHRVQIFQVYSKYTAYPGLVVTHWGHFLVVCALQGQINGGLE